MVRQILAAATAAVCICALNARAQAAYRIEHVYWGNENVRDDRLYVRDVRSGRRMVLSRHWGGPCKKRAALNYGLEGGCWYPVRERYSAWPNKARGWVQLKPRALERELAQWIGRLRFVSYRRPHRRG